MRRINPLDHIETLKKMLCEHFTFIEMMIYNSEK